MQVRSTDTSARELDPIWQHIRKQTRCQAEAEPILASFLHATILNHDSLEAALSFHLANKLDSPTAPAMLIREVIASALEDDPSICYGFGYHANGVNTAPWVGKTLADMLAGSNSGAVNLPAVLSGLPRRFAIPGLRLWGLRAAYWHYRRTDD